jgi:adenylosuccinate synthase
LLHGGEYPFATSRETSATGALAETGLSPIDVDDVVLVIRAHPIRVAGNSGALPSEITWDEVTTSGEHDHQLVEFTTVTKRVRRVGAFHPDVVRRALIVNKPTAIVLNHLDYLDHSACLTEDPTPRIAEFVSRVESAIEHPIDFWGLDPTSLRLGNGEVLRIDHVDDLALSVAE